MLPVPQKDSGGCITPILASIGLVFAAMVFFWIAGALSDGLGGGSFADVLGIVIAILAFFGAGYLVEQRRR